MIIFLLIGCTKNDFQPTFSICIDMLNSLVVVTMCGADLNIFAFQLSDKPASIVLVDTFSYFEVHVTTRNTMYSKVCPMIRVAAKALKYNNSTPVPAFFCKCSSPPHAATPDISDDDCYLMCTKCSNAVEHSQSNTLCGWMRQFLSGTLSMVSIVCHFVFSTPYGDIEL